MAAPHRNWMAPVLETAHGFARYAALAEAVEHLPDGYLALASDAFIVDRNRAASLLIESCRHALGMRNGRLVGHTSGIRAALSEGLLWCSSAGKATAATGFVRAVVVHRRPSHLPVVLRMHPMCSRMHESDSRHGPVAIAWLIDTSAHEKEAEGLKRLFNLTEAEGRVAQTLASGKSLSDVAREMKVNRSTAKTHLDAVFSKTGCRRQAQLVRLIACLRGVR